MKREKREKNPNERKMEEQKEKNLLEEKRDRKIDWGIRLGEMGVKILIWFFRD
ncbi:hypothetical protein [Bacillus cereus]|uniref:hypothetical protein n=1 Tax=Bacillus cereus TaxID=1396 RepID=UPI0014834F35|nr:hypothetical protein [Bacillus cereus]